MGHCQHFANVSQESKYNHGSCIYIGLQCCRRVSEGLYLHATGADLHAVQGCLCANLNES